MQAVFRNSIHPLAIFITVYRITEPKPIILNLMQSLRSLICKNLLLISYKRMILPLWEILDLNFTASYILIN